MAPSVLMAEDPEILSTLIRVHNFRAEQAQREARYGR